MSSYDLYEDGFPHSTKEGYAQGCRGAHCPGKLDFGFSCREAQMWYQGDYAFKRQVDAGMSPTEIAATRVAQEHAQPVQSTGSVKVKHSAEPVPKAAPKPKPPLATIRPPKWAVRRVWIAFAPDGTMHGPFDGQPHAVSFIGERLATAPVVAPSKKPKREPRPQIQWTKEMDTLIANRNADGISDKKISDELRISQPIVSARRRALGLRSAFPSPNRFRTTP